MWRCSGGCASRGRDTPSVSDASGPSVPRASVVPDGVWRRAAGERADQCVEDSGSSGPHSIFAVFLTKWRLDPSGLIAAGLHSTSSRDTVGRLPRAVRDQVGTGRPVAEERNAGDFVFFSTTAHRTVARGHCRGRRLVRARAELARRRTRGGASSPYWETRFVGAGSSSGRRAPPLATSRPRGFGGNCRMCRSFSG